jgi:hypothetical protein
MLGINGKFGGVNWITLFFQANRLVAYSEALARPFLNPAEKFACVCLVVVSWCYILVFV